MVHAALGNEGIGQWGLATASDNFGPKVAHSFPVTFQKWKPRQLLKYSGSGGGEFGVAKKLRQDDRRKHSLFLPQDKFHRVHIGAF